MVNILPTDPRTLTSGAFSDGPGLVQVVSPAQGKTLWTHELTGESSLSGEPPRVMQSKRKKAAAGAKRSSATAFCAASRLAIGW